MNKQVPILFTEKNCAVVVQDVMQFVLNLQLI